MCLILGTHVGRCSLLVRLTKISEVCIVSVGKPHCTDGNGESIVSHEMFASVLFYAVLTISHKSEIKTGLKCRIWYNHINTKRIYF